MIYFPNVNRFVVVVHKKRGNVETSDYRLIGSRRREREGKKGGFSQSPHPSCTVRGRLGWVRIPYFTFHSADIPIFGREYVMTACKKKCTFSFFFLREITF